MKQVGAYLGDSERGLSDINPIGFALGLAIGVAVGLVYVPLPGGGFSLGAAAGTLIVGLVFGRLVRIGPFVVSMGQAAASSLSNFGMLTFLAYAGSRAGEKFAASVTSDLGWKVFVLGVVMTTLAAVSVSSAGRLLHTNSRQLAGIVAGAAHASPRCWPSPTSAPGLTSGWGWATRWSTPSRGPYPPHSRGQQMRLCDPHIDIYGPFGWGALVGGELRGALRWGRSDTMAPCALSSPLTASPEP